jgi:hypothetical protein
VLEVLRVKARVELAIQHAQDVAVELGREALGVVVGGLEHLRVLDQVGAHQQEVILVQEFANLAQEAPAAAGGEVADRAAEKRDDARADRGRHAIEVSLEVADHAVHLKARILLGQLGGAVAHHLLGDVDGHVAAQRAGVVERVEQHPRLGRGPRAQLDQLTSARQPRELVGLVLENRALGARRVVLGQLADAVEQLGAARVVEVLRRQFLERPREAVEHVVRERAFIRPCEVRVDADCGLGKRLRGHERLHR